MLVLGEEGLKVGGVEVGGPTELREGEVGEEGGLEREVEREPGGEEVKIQSM